MVSLAISNPTWAFINWWEASVFGDSDQADGRLCLPQEPELQKSYGLYYRVSFFNFLFLSFLFVFPRHYNFLSLLGYHSSTEPTRIMLSLTKSTSTTSPINEVQ